MVKMSRSRKSAYGVKSNRIKSSRCRERWSTCWALPQRFKGFYPEKSWTSYCLIARMEGTLARCCPACKVAFKSNMHASQSAMDTRFWSMIQSQALQVPQQNKSCAFELEVVDLSAYVYHVDFQVNSTSNSVNCPCASILFVAQPGITQNYRHIDSTAAISVLAWVRRVFQVNSFLSQNSYVKVENQRKIRMNMNCFIL